MSVTVIGPIVASLDTLATPIVYVMLLPTVTDADGSVLVMARSISGSTTVVRSDALLFPVLVSPPPDTVAVLVSDDGAVGVTSTVSVMGARLAPAATGPGLVHLSLHTFVVRSGKNLILVDTCVGNHKKRSAVPDWVDYSSDYIGKLAAVGVKPAGRTSLTEIAAVLPPLPMFETANV